MNFVRQKIALIFLFNISCVVFAQKNYGDVVVSDVYDGDTFRVNIKGYPDIIGKNVSIRIADIDTPELRSKSPRLKEKAYAARDFLRELLLSAEKIVLRNIRRGKYFRIVADVILDDELDVAEELIKKKFARVYNGKTTKPWIDG